MQELIIELPDSPGVEVKITRGGKDPLTGEALPNQYVTVEWTPEGHPTQTRGFLGPE